ncbi:hypothetical protein RchiOBHm_Chr6g0267831 [Rosa chinensis]|uniref:Transmembrane protein n=1 Tax=Rosa chinensis TaxID=74649 RepID=A0A2P6PQ05_ROSCH|nr:hypothetical protein RchiOBHm_Chr6g0267831 [Rosa chinensis]
MGKFLFEPRIIVELAALHFSLAAVIFCCVIVFALISYLLPLRVGLVTCSCLPYSCGGCLCCFCCMG